VTLRSELSVNGERVVLEVEASERLVDALRNRLGLTGTKEACGNGECGACTVLLDGRAVNACLVLAVEASGRSVTTIEGLSDPGGELSRIQRAFVKAGGIQCGFCSPGMILAAKALLDENPAPTEEQIRRALVGNLCRCTGYTQIIGAVKLAAGGDDV
jgi:aerobic carbon-monoxide dehydrogenase small subunit